MHRRHFVVSVGVAFAATRVGDFLLSGRVARALESASPSSPTQAAASPSAHPEIALPDAIGSGLSLAGGFRVVQAHEVFHGALPFVIDGEGQRFQIDVLRRTESGTSGVAATEHFSLFVHGSGGPTQERGARVLGLALEQRIQSGIAAPLLASFDERAQTRDAFLNVDFVAVHV